MCIRDRAYLQSAIVAANCPPIASATPLTASVDRQGGACPGFYVNREPFLDVIRMHRAEVNNIGKSRQSGEPFNVPQLDALIDSSRECWDMALVYGERYGYRNSQTTVLAPTGTIGSVSYTHLVGQPECAGDQVHTGQCFRRNFRDRGGFKCCEPLQEFAQGAQRKNGR